MSIEKVKAYFSQYGIADRVREFEVSSATVELAAQALNCEPCRIAKTLSFMVDYSRNTSPIPQWTIQSRYYYCHKREKQSQTALGNCQDRL